MDLANPKKYKQYSNKLEELNFKYTKTYWEK